MAYHQCQPAYVHPTNAVNLLLETHSTRESDSEPSGAAVLSSMRCTLLTMMSKRPNVVRVNATAASIEAASHTLHETNAALLAESLLSAATVSAPL